eukprot:CAMPEP_0172192970 /NCGR_PEP_ID=MMETSP1050-20130122/24662_1 /TAXON_ID=233186 /ORGANISM="Cryptomonas curvata, Strain CCAP979/52" /LENGTH=117 /DNA_ID=CAMNT_0012868409 /DNA_START=13 /DNA_END=366 /DNA_ORIENTATION=+
MAQQLLQNACKTSTGIKASTVRSENSTSKENFKLLSSLLPAVTGIHDGAHQAASAGPAIRLGGYPSQPEVGRGFSSSSEAECGPAARASGPAGRAQVGSICSMCICRADLRVRVWQT